MNRPAPQPWVAETQVLDNIAEDTPRAGPLAPLIIGCALFMQSLDSTVISSALPTMARSLHESPLTLNMGITSYLLASAVFLPISGWIADRFGARRVFRIAIVVFAVASLLCGLSQNLPEMIGARVLQGLAGALMAPVGRLLVLKSVAKADLVRAMSYLTTPAVLGPILGPPVGGLIVTYLSWRWVFFINIPIAVVGVTLISLYVSDVREEERRPLDWPGFLLTGIGLAAAMYALENLGQNSISPLAISVLLAVGAACLWLFTRHARTAAHPILDLSILRLNTFQASVVGGLFSRMILGATPFLLTLLLQMAFGLSAFTAGLMTFASAAGMLVMKFTATPILRKLGFRPVLIGSCILTGASLMQYALFRADTPHALIIGCLLVGGFFRSLQLTALNAFAFAEVPTPRMSNASTVASMAMPLAQCIGVAAAVISLHAAQATYGTHNLTTAVISPSFIVIGGLSMLGLIYFVRLPKDAGAVISGKK